MGQALRSDDPESMRDMVLFIGHQARWDDWCHLLHSVQTGEPSVIKLRGMTYWDYLEKDEDLAQVFNNAMTSTSGITNEIALNQYDFTNFKLIVDVGGGHGATAVDHPGPRATGPRCASTIWRRSSPTPTPRSRPRALTQRMLRRGRFLLREAFPKAVMRT